MTDMPLVSLITPSYNQAQFITQTIESVLMQDYPHFEYIIVDSSDDNTPNILQGYANVPYLTVVYTPPTGFVDALIMGFAQARGEIMGWLNSDDTFVGQPIADTVQCFIEQPAVDLVYGQSIFTDAQGEQIQHLPILGSAVDLVNLLSDNTPIPQPGTFWRRRLWQRVGGLRSEFSSAVDTALWLDALQHGGKFHFMPGIRSTYRLHDASKTVADAVTGWTERGMLAEQSIAQPKMFPKATAASRLIRSNLALGLAQAHYALNENEKAKQYIRRSLRYSPLRLRWFYILSLVIDYQLGTHLSERLAHFWQRIRP